MMPARNSFQFPLRAPLLLMTAVCVVLGWHVQTAMRQREALKSIESMGGLLGYGRDNPDYPTLVLFPGYAVENDDGLAVSPTLTDEGLSHVGRLTKLDSLMITNAPITDAGLPCLYQLKNLRQIVFDDTNVSVAGIAELQKALPRCKIDHYPSIRQTGPAATNSN